MSFKRILSLSLVFLFAVLALVGCKKEDTTVDSDGIELLDTPIVIADASGVYYKVARPQQSTTVYTSCSYSVATHSPSFSIQQTVAKESDNATASNEILIGNTCRAQSKDTLSSIGFDDFKITTVDGMIVIAAHTPERLTEAVDFLKENLLKETDGRLEYIGNYHFKSEEALMVDEGESWADYKIVCCDDNLYSAANSIKKFIKDTCGEDVEVIYDSKPKEGKEIVLGSSVKRDICSLTQELAIGEFLVAVKDKDLLVAAKDETSSLKALEVFKSDYLSGVYSDTFNFVEGFSLTDNAYRSTFSDSAAFTEGSDIRVMSFNLLVDIWADTPPVSGRDKTVASTILCYKPDVIGFQETSSNWHSAIKNAIKNTPYKLICVEHENYSHEKYGKTCFTPILYNSDTVKLIESGVEEFVESDNHYMKTIAWAYFEHTASGKKFVQVNTHFTPSHAEQSLEYRTAQALEVLALADSLESQYDCPVLITGDFNSTEGKDKENAHKPYWSIIDGGFSDAKYSATKINRNCSTWHELGAQVSTATANSLDHIFGNEKVKFTYFNTLVDKILMSASDHCPIYADVILK